MRILFRSALIGSVLAMLGCEMSDEEGLAGDEPEVWAEEALGPIAVANRTPLGLAASATHLYWTSLDIDPLGAMTAVVWASPKDGSPGDEIPIQTRFEPAGTSSFHVFENVALPAGGGPYLYVVQNDSDDGLTGSYILRISQAGGPPTLIGASDYVGARPIATDGARVFWSDPWRVWRVPVGGGTLGVVSEQPSPVLAVDGTYVYYVVGSGIRRMASAGGPLLNAAGGAPPITALYAQPSSHTVFWGESNAVVRSASSPTGPVTTYQGPTTGRVVTSVGTGSSRVTWIDCLSNGTDCAVRVWQAGVTTTVAAGLSGAGHLQWDATSLYWGQDGGLMKYVF